MLNEADFDSLQGKIMMVIRQVLQEKLVLKPQPTWDVNVVEFETGSATFDQLAGWISDAILALPEFSDNA